MDFPESYKRIKYPNNADRGPFCSNPGRLNDHNCACEIFDRAVVLLLQREEELLRDIVEQCGNLVTQANQEALYLMESIEKEV